MAVSTVEVTLVLLLGVGLIIAIWVYIVSKRETTTVSSQPYARGANLAAPGKVPLVCDPGSTIQVASAMMVCTNPDSNNFENPATDPFLSTGAFNAQTTYDLSSDMTTSCNTKEQCLYNFGKNDSFTCPGTPQLIATYTCIPKSA
jgi:hypothetical protein